MHGPDPHGGRPEPTLLACEVFRSALRHLGIDHPESSGRIVYLPAHLHLHPERLRAQLLERLESGGSVEPYAGCLYGKCFPEIDTVLRSRKIERISCAHCYEILLSKRVHAEWMREWPGSFFLEKSIIEDFDNLCRIPLELDDAQMRQWYFEHYQKIVYIRQPRDAGLMQRVRAIATLLDLDCTVLQADYTDLIAYLKKQGIF